MNRSDDLFPQPGGQPDPHWQRVFDEAFETPPPRVWEGVERQLDLDDDDGILPLWRHREGRQAMLFGRWTAGIAASLALTLIGWWAWHRENAIRPDRPSVVVAQNPTRSSQGPISRPAEAVSTRTTAGAVASHETPVPAIDHQLANRYRAATSQTATPPPPTHPAEVYASLSTMARLAVDAASDQLFTVSGQPGGGRPDLVAQQLALNHWEQHSLLNELVQVGMTQSNPTHSFTFQSQLNQPLPTSAFAQVNGRPTRTYGAWINQTYPTAPLQPGGRAAQRTVMIGFTSDEHTVNADALAEAAPVAKPMLMRSLTSDRVARSAAAEQPTAEPVSGTSKSRKQRAWLSVGLATSTFNPAVAIREATLSTAVAVPTSATDRRVISSLQSQAGRAVAVQASVGIPVSERWSLETGVGYLTGYHDVQSPSRLTPMGQLSGATTLYTDLVVRSASQAGMANFIADPTNAIRDSYNNSAGNLTNVAATYGAGQVQLVSNAYQFVQVPVQMGYELRPRRKFGLALLTGLVSNWFVKNTVAESITVTPGDGVYRPVTLAGSAGLRLRYRPDSHWSASMAGTFQQNLQSLTRSDVGLQAQPQQVGVSFSVDKQF